MSLSQSLGFLGTGFVALAYISADPSLGQRTLLGWDQHERFALRCIASMLFLIHAATIRDVVFVVVQIVNLTAIVAIVLCVKKYERQMCLTHLQETHRKQALKV